MLSTVDSIEHQPIMIDVGDDITVVVTIDATHQAWGEVEITTERLADVVVELVAVGCSVHDDNGTIKLVRILGKLFF